MTPSDWKFYWTYMTFSIATAICFGYIVSSLI